MEKKKAQEYGHLTAALASAQPLADVSGQKPVAPKLRIQAMMDSLGSVGDDNDYHQKAAEGLRKEIKHGEDAITNWDHVSVGKQALHSFKRDLASKKAKLLEHEAFMSDDDEDTEQDAPDFSGKGKVPKEVGAKGKDQSSVGPTRSQVRAATGK